MYNTKYMNKIEFLKNRINEINENLKGAYLNKINELSSLDYLFSFSRSSAKSLFLSLSSPLPFIKLIDKKTKESLSSLFLQILKIKLLNSCFIEASIYNDDSIIDLKFIKTTDTYDKIEYHLLFEMFKGNTNLILLNKNEIELAFRYHSLETSHPLIIKTTYIPPKKIELNKEFDVENELIKEDEYVKNLENKYLKEKYNSLIAQLKRKRKSLLSKKEDLESDIKKANKNLSYKDYADYYLTIMNDLPKGSSSFTFEDKIIPLKVEYNTTGNLNYLYKIYKKAKQTIALTQKFLDETIDEIEYIDNILNLKDIYNENDYFELIDELKKRNIIKIKNKNIKEVKIKAISPYYIEYNNVKIGFGKNNLQNNELTFKLAKKNDYYLHLANEHSPHIVIFLNNSPLSDDVLKEAMNLLLNLTKKDDASIYLANIKDVKKGSYQGEANLLKYETYYFKKDKELNEEIKNAKRFI